MLRGKTSTQYKWCSSRSNRSSRSTPSFDLPRVHGGGGPDAGRSNDLNRLNGWNGLNPGSFAAGNRRARASMRYIFHCANIAVLVLFVSGCDPILNIGGTFFPGWMVAILIGRVLALAIGYIFVFTGLEPHVGPLALIYTSLGVLLSVVSWLILYRS